MTLLRGILDSKGRRAVWERNQSLRAPEQPPVNPHAPQVDAKGVVNCCGGRYSPAAHALHLNGERLATLCAGVAVSGIDDPWLIAEEQRLKAERSDTPADDEAIRRGELIDAYFAQRRKAIARRVSGTSNWMTE